MRSNWMGCALAVGLGVSAVASAPAAAQDAMPGEISATATMASQYVFRGITQSDENAAIQGSFDWSHDSGVYLGAWGSSIDFNDGNAGGSMELDFYGGLAGDVGLVEGLTYDVGLIYYYYPGADGSQNYDYVEGMVALGYELGGASLGVSLNYSPEYFGESGTFFYPAGSIGFSLPYGFGIDASMGYNDIDDEAAFGVPSYMDWSLGLTYAWWGFDLDLRYIDTDLTTAECADGCGDRVVFSVSRTF